MKKATDLQPGDKFDGGDHPSQAYTVQEVDATSMPGFVLVTVIYDATGTEDFLQFPADGDAAAQGVIESETGMNLPTS